MRPREPTLPGPAEWPGGGLVTAALRPVEGAEQIARFYAGIVGLALDVTILERTVNGQPGLVAQLDGVVTVFAFGIAGDRIKHIWAVRNPEKLPVLDDRLTRTAGSTASGPTSGGNSRRDLGPRNPDRRIRACLRGGQRGGMSCRFAGPGWQ